MSDIFKVGEVAILKQDPDTPDDLMRLDGDEVEIIGALGFYDSYDGPFWSYEVRHPAGYEFYSAPHELRRRKPPTTGEQSILALFKGVPQQEKEPA